MILENTLGSREVTNSVDNLGMKKEVRVPRKYERKPKKCPLAIENVYTIFYNSMYAMAAAPALNIEAAKKSINQLSNAYGLPTRKLNRLLKKGEIKKKAEEVLQGSLPKLRIQANIGFLIGDIGAIIFNHYDEGLYSYHQSCDAVYRVMSFLAVVQYILDNPTMEIKRADINSKNDTTPES